MRSRVLSATLATLMVVTALPLMAAIAAPVGDEYQITDQINAQNKAEIQGDIVVWEDHRQTNGPNLYARDLGGGGEFLVGGGNAADHNASVYGDYIAYSRSEQYWSGSSWSDQSDVYLYNAATNETMRLAGTSACENQPTVSENRVVWQSDESGTYEMYAYDFATGKTSKVTSSTVDKYEPESDGDVLVYNEWSPGNLIAYDFSTSKTTTVVAGWGNGHVKDLHVQDGVVVWIGYPPSTSDWTVFAYDLEASTLTTVCVTYNEKSSPDVWDDKVVFCDSRNDGVHTDYDIYMYDLETSKEETLTASNRDDKRPRIDNGTVVWHSDRGGENAEIYGIDLQMRYAGIEGSNRYETAVAASRKSFAAGADTVVIVTGSDWPDALSAVGLAGAVDGPVLLTYTDRLPGSVIREIDRLGAKNAYIVGGTGVVSSEVMDDLEDILAGKVWRIFGADRYATADAAAQRTAALQGADFDGTCFVATGANFPDALAAAPLAAANGLPIFLSRTDGLTDESAAAMSAIGCDEALVLGGTSAISADAMAALPVASSARLAGDTRYTTALAVAEYGVDEMNMSWDGVALATGQNFPDALAGGVMQGKNGNVMLLTPSDTLTTDVEAKLTKIKDKIGVVRYLGGTGAISQAVRDAVEGL